MTKLRIVDFEPAPAAGQRFIGIEVEHLYWVVAAGAPRLSGDHPGEDRARADASRPTASRDRVGHRALSI
jgi:hypothetical protein